MSDFVWRSWRSADGLTLWGRDYAAAEGPARLPVICLHGLTRNSRDFEEVAPWLAGLGRRTLALDVRGRGRSDRAQDPASYQPGVYAADVIALMDALGLARAEFIGTSMGGLITMTLAAMAPERVAGAVLNDVGPVIAKAGVARIFSYAGQPPEIADWAAAVRYARETNGAVFPAYSEADWQAFARRVFREGEAGRPVLDYDPRIMQAISLPAEGPVPDVWPVFDQLAAGRPLLLIRGGLSDLLDEAGTAAMRERAPAMSYGEVPGVGHAPMLTEPEAQDAIARFLAAAP